MIVPSSPMSILAPENSTISRITLPPVPITSRIFSLGTVITVILGALAATPPRFSVSARLISPRMCRRPSCACPNAIFMISKVMEVILMSICSAVMPASVPATLKSMSPRWSSSPRMSDSTANPRSSLIRPMAMPATGRRSGTPASISARLVPHTVAMRRSRCFP